jgi:hypothetical protein
MITSQQELLLKQYQERSFVLSILAEESCNYYHLIKNIVNIPLIICNSIMVCINSIIIDPDLLKILNIILNTSTGLILSLISSFKIYEHITTFNQLRIKYTKLTHLLDTKLTNEIDKIDNDFIQTIINDYDAITEANDFQYPLHIRSKVKKQYENKLCMPASLAVEIVECESQCRCVKV